MTVKTTRDSWPNKPMPAARAALEIEATIEPDAFTRIAQGFAPRTPDDKWFIYLADDGWLHVHRSASGSCIFLAKFERVDENYTITESWVNRDPQQYKGEDAAYDARLFIYLIRKLLLNHNVPFPTPAHLPHRDKPTHEQHVMGAGNDGASFIPLNLLNGNL